jgi:hypothetical protein
MLAIDRWRNWHPSNERYGEYPGCEPSKPTEAAFEGFEGSSSTQIENFSDLPPDAPDAWKKDFKRWKAENCIYRAGREDSGGIGFLLVDFAEWCAAHNAVPCTRATFELLLRDAGFPLTDGLARGLVLRVDVEAVSLLQGAVQDSGTPARAAVEKRRKSSG